MTDAGLTAAQERWATELESGRFTQWTGYLSVRSAGQEYHCCLGVAERTLNGEGEWIPGGNSKDRSTSEYHRFAYTGEDGQQLHRVGQLSPGVAAQLGLSTEKGDFTLTLDSKEIIEDALGYVPHRTPLGGTLDLVMLNDLGMNFAQTARLIRSRPKGMFVDAP